MSGPLPLKLYRLATVLAEPFAPLALKARLKRGKEDPARIGERLGRASLPRPQGPLVWIHGASVGESLSHLPLTQRWARERPDVVLSLAVLDIVPTYAMFMDTNRHVAGAYWHWYFLSQPAPFPERVIGNDPDLFYETCLIGWGATRVEDFDPEMLADYRRCWRDFAMIHGSCSDYRAAATIDLGHDGADLDRKVTCRTLVLYGASGTMARCFDIPVEWRKRCADVRAASLPGGHFFVDQFPRETAEILVEFLRGK